MLDKKDVLLCACGFHRLQNGMGISILKHNLDHKHLNGLAANFSRSTVSVQIKFSSILYSQKSNIYKYECFRLSNVSKRSVVQNVEHQKHVEYDFLSLHEFINYSDLVTLRLRKT